MSVSELTKTQQLAQQILENHQPVVGYYDNPGSPYACLEHRDLDGDLLIEYPCAEVRLACGVLGQPVPDAVYVEDPANEREYTRPYDVPTVDWEPTRERLDALIAALPKTLDIATRVDFTAGWLDRTRPGWALVMDPELFSIHDGGRCVYGMLDDDYQTGVRGMLDSFPDSFPVAQALGFDSLGTDAAALLLGISQKDDDWHGRVYEARRGDPAFSKDQEWTMLQEAWLLAISTRQAAANDAQRASSEAAEQASAQTEMGDASAREI